MSIDDYSDYKRRDDSYSDMPAGGGNVDLIEFDVDDEAFVDGVHVVLSQPAVLAIEERNDDDEVLDVRWFCVNTVADAQAGDSHWQYRMDLDWNQSIKDVTDGEKVVLVLVTDFTEVEEPQYAWMRIKERRK